ncbi:hypothetical protein ABPG77_005206 [Micractinium sp. CCAP 211/92]
MAIRQALCTLQRSLAPYASSKLAPRAFGSSTASWWSAEAVQDKVPDPETAGWGSTLVGEVMKAKEDSGAWLWCSADDMVIDAVRKMTHANVGSLLVFDPSKLHLVCTSKDRCTNTSKDAVVGIITERDYLNKVVVKGKQSSSTRVSEIMTPAGVLETVTPQHSVLDVMGLMVDKNFRHVPVIDQGNMIGMLSMRDVVHIVLKEHREEVGRLQEYIQGTF